MKPPRNALKTPFISPRSAFILVLLLLSGCATPVGVSRVPEEAVYRQIDESALTGVDYSAYTGVVLHRHGLREADFKKDPHAFIQGLHRIAAADGREDLWLALSELCFLAAKKASAEDEASCDPMLVYASPPPVMAPRQPVDPNTFFLGASVYAYWFLMGNDREAPLDAFDRRFRLACDLYNRSLARLVTVMDGKLAARDCTLALPAGRMRLSFTSLEVPWDVTELANVLPADGFEVHGLSVRNRMPGLGAPILAVRKKGPGVPVSSAVPATVFMSVKAGQQWSTLGECFGEVSIHAAASLSGNDITVDGKTVPLEMDLTAPIAYSLNDPILWSMGRQLFRLGRSQFNPGIYTIAPHLPGKIPIVFVHGTLSSPAWWAEMFNTLLNDPEIRRRYQIWLYLYDSGKPVVFSATHLREAIQKRIKKCDPEGRDPALKQLVVVGHSQGGLLARYLTVETGDAIIRAVTGKPLDAISLSPRQRELVMQYAVFRPLPEVKRVIFIATPHRGSILAGSFVRRMAGRVIALPREVFQTGMEFFSIFERFSVAGKIKWSMARTSIDSMAPDNPMLLAMASLPIPPGVTGHSIIAVDGDKQPPEGDDGVVAYRSAHLEGVASEKVVPYGHSCQMEPMVIEEVRRILIAHVESLGDPL